MSRKLKKMLLCLLLIAALCVVYELWLAPYLAVLNGEPVQDSTQAEVSEVPGITVQAREGLKEAYKVDGLNVSISGPEPRTAIGYLGPNHFLILVVDGRIGFTGGINIAQRYLTGNRLGPWRDTHLKLEGEAVGMLQIIFMTDWFFVSKERLIDYPKYLPKTHVKTETPIQIVTSGPDSDWASIMQAFFSAITHAQHHIYISSPYFLPNEAILTAIKVASLSGIDVRIMIPSRSDSKIVYWASRSYIEELIDANVKVYLYRRGFNHSKLIMIDGKFSSVGTANMDIRSFEDNFEVSAILYDKGITEELEERFLYDLQRSRLVTREYWDSRPTLHNFYEALSRLFSPLL